MKLNDMTKQELIDIIKATAKKQYSPSKVDLDSSASKKIDFDANKFPILIKFPELKAILIDLLTEQYEVFLKEIQWVAPRPTTFKIILNNGQSFYMMHTDRSWVAKVEGKKYYLLNLPEEEKAAEAISRILSYAWDSEPEKEPENKGETPPESPESTEETLPEPEEEAPKKPIPAEV
jgi:hypothetical protein